MGYIFLSYSHKDLEKVMPVIKQISDKYQVIYDTNIGAAREYNDEIADMIIKAEMVVSFISKNYLLSSYCIDEILFARTNEKPILLTYIEPTELSAGLQLRLGRFQSVDLNSPDFMLQITHIPILNECKVRQIGKLIREETCEKVYYSRKLVLPIGVQINYENETEQKCVYDMEEYGHLIICGLPQGGKSTLVQMMLYYAITNYSARELYCYIVDMNNYMYECFARAPQVGEIINKTAKRRIHFMISHLKKIISERETMIRSGIFTQYNRLHGDSIPRILVVIDDIERVFLEINEKQWDELTDCIREGARYGIYFIIIYSGKHGVECKDIKKMVRSEVLLFPLCREELERYLYVRDMPREIVLTEKWTVGNGVLLIDANYCYIKTELAIESDNSYMREQLIEMQSEKLRQEWSGNIADGLADVPEELDSDMFFSRSEVSERLGSGFLPYGLSMEDGSIVSFNLDKIFTYIILSKNISEAQNMLKVVQKSAEYLRSEIVIFDTPGRESLRMDKEDRTYINCVEQFNGYLVGFLDEIRKRNLIKRTMKTDAEINDKMKSFKPIFFIVEDLLQFCELSDRTNFNAICNIIEKGAGHRFYILAALGYNECKRIRDNTIYTNLTKDQYGVMGMPPDHQMMFMFENIDYKDSRRTPEKMVLINFDGTKVKIPRFYE